MLLGIAPPGLLEVIDCVDDRMTIHMDPEYAGGGKWLRQTFGSPRQCSSASSWRRKSGQEDPYRKREVPRGPDHVMQTQCEGVRTKGPRGVAKELFAHSLFGARAVCRAMQG